MSNDGLVSSEILAARLGDPNLRIADASWYLPQAGRNPRAEYEAAHIPGAVFFDIDRNDFGGPVLHRAFESHLGS